MRTRSFALAAFTVLASTAAARAQDLQYRTVSRMEMGGALREIGSALGAGKEVVQTTSVKGGRMRTDADRLSTIVDLEARRIIVLDHTRKVYSEMSMDALKGSSAAPGATTDTDFKVSVDPTRERQTINGEQAERVFVTIEVTGRKNDKQGQMVVLNELWVAKNAEAFAAMKKFNDAAGDGLDLAGAAAGDRKMAAAMKKAAEEMRKIEGMPVRTITYMVMLPVNAKFNRASLLADDQKKPADPQKGGQMVMMKTTNEVRDVKAVALEDSLFVPPAGYVKK